MQRRNIGNKLDNIEYWHPRSVNIWVETIRKDYDSELSNGYTDRDLVP